MRERKELRFPIPPEAPIHPCSSCGKAIVWSVTATGKRMPLSWETKDHANTALSHFADCPNAATHRKPKTPKP